MNYIQKHINGYVHTIMRVDNIISDNAIEVSEYNPWYIGTYFDGTNFMKLELEPDNLQIALNNPVNLAIKWVDIQKQIVNRDCIITVKCGNITENVTVVAGIGNTTFESAESGKFILEATSPEGCKAEGKVIVG